MITVTKLNLVTQMQFVLIFCLILTWGGTLAQTITSNGTGKHGDFTYEFWKDAGGTGTMTLGPEGTFTCEWNGINNILFRTGHRPGSFKSTVSYSVDYKPDGNSYLCLYGWTTDPLIEYYVVESWGSWRPPGAKPIGTVSSDGGTYDIYKTERVNQPSIRGRTTFYQFWSVRTEKRTDGTITLANHVNEWAKHGLELGNIYEVSFTIEGYQSNGTAKVNRLSITPGGNNTGSEN